MPKVNLSERALALLDEERKDMPVEDVALSEAVVYLIIEVRRLRESVDNRVQRGRAKPGFA